MSGRIKTYINYLPKDGGNELQGPPTEAKTAEKGSANGEANASGNKATSKNPNGQGGEKETEENWNLPEGGTFKSAEIEVELNCGKGKTKTLTCKGNESVFGDISGSCITCTEVNSKTDAEGKVTTTRNSKKECC